jgi:WD40 repeat protein/serine/threonine protein kinase/tetratricopeptide (TPR) repeat protein
MSSDILGQQGNPTAAGTRPAPVPGYELLRELGRGHTGVVHKALQLLYGRPVALKVVNDETLGGAHDLTAFAAAGRAALRLAHPNIVTLYEVGDAAGQPYLASEWVEGESLRQRLARRPLPAGAAARMVETLARAVQYAHEKGVLHGHLSPANVLLGPGDTPRIADFGLAAFLGGSRPGHPFPADPAYAAPEQAGGPPPVAHAPGSPPSGAGEAPRPAPDLRLQALAGPRKHGALSGPVKSPMESAAERGLRPAVDVYGLGAVLYALLTGRPPLLGASREQTLELVRSRRPVPPGRLHHGLAADLEAICLKCLSKRPGRRYRSALDLAEALRRYREGRRVQAWPAALAGRAARWCRDNLAAVAAFGLLTLAFAAVLALSVRGRRSALDDLAKVEAKHRDTAQQVQEVSKLRDQEAAAKAAAGQQAEQAQRERLTALQERDEARTRLAEQTKGRQIAVAAFQAETAKRVDAQERARTAEELGKQAAERRAEVARHLMAMHVATGTRLLDEGNLAGALPWFVQVLRLAQAERLPEEAHRLRLAATLGRCARPVQVWHSDKKLNVVRLSPDGRRVLAAGTEGALLLWDSDKGKAGEPMLHGVAVTDAVFSPDGKRALTACADNSVHLWDLEMAREVVPAMMHMGPVLGMAFRPDGKQVLTVSTRGPQNPSEAEVRLWDAASGEPSENPLGSQVAPYPAEFSPDGKRVLTVCLDRCARVWDATGGNQVGASLEHPAAVRRASFSPDGRLVVTAGADGTARLWDAATGKPAVRPLNHGAPVWDASFGAGGRYVLTAGEDRVVRTWDAATGEPIGQAIHHDEPLTRAAFSPDGRHVLGADEGGMVRVWDAATGAAVVPPLRQGGAVRHAVFDPSGRLVLTAEDRVVRLWDLATAGLLAPETRETRGLVFSPDGRKAVQVGGRALQVLDARSGKRMGEPLAHEQDATIAAFSPDGKRLLAVCPEGEGAVVHVWDLESGKKVGAALDHARPVTGASFGPDGKRVLTVCGDKKVRVWDAATGDPLGQPLDHNADLVRALFTPGGDRVLSIDVQGTVRVWDPAEGKQVGRAFGPEGPLHHLGFSPDGKRVVTTGSDGTARVWDLATGEAVTKWMLHGAAVVQAAFRPDGKRLATASADRTARVWDAESGEPIAPPLRHRTAVALAVFSADGRWLLTAAGNSVRLWDAATGAALGPDLPHGRAGGAIHFASLAGGRLVTAVGTPGDPAGRWERTLRPDDRPLADLEQLAGVCAAVRVDAGGNSLPLDGKEAAAAWQALRQKYPADWAAGEERVRAWERRAAGECEARGLWQGAIGQLGRLLEASPSADLYGRRARAHAELRQWEPALADYTKALEGDAGRADLRVGRAEAAVGLGRWEQAVADYTKAIEQKGDDADLWMKRGRVEAERGHWQQAAADLGKAVALGRTDADVRHQYAVALLAAGDREGYRRACTRLAQRGGGGDDEASQRLLSRACTLAADAVPDLEPLLRRAEKAVEADPRSAADQEWLGALLYRAGKYEPALRRLEEAVRLSGSEPAPRALLFLAMANQRQGRGEEARKRLDEAAAREKAGAASSWVEKKEYQLLRREAEELLQAAKP